MTVCVDSSLALKWVLAERGSEDAEQLLIRWRNTHEEIIAPSHFFVEVASVLTQRTMRAGPDRVEPEYSRRALALLLTVGVDIHHSPDLHRRALELAIDMGQPTTYDTHYLALAESRKCHLWTADEKLFRAACDRFPMIHILTAS